MFFIPVTLNGTNSIMLDHIVSALLTAFSSLTPYYALIVIALGAVYPFVAKTWKESACLSRLPSLKFSASSSP